MCIHITHTRTHARTHTHTHTHTHTARPLVGDNLPTGMTYTTTDLRMTNNVCSGCIHIAQSTTINSGINQSVLKGGLHSGTTHNTSPSDVTIALVSGNTCVAGFVSSTLCQNEQSSPVIVFFVIYRVAQNKPDYLLCGPCSVFLQQNT